MPATMKGLEAIPSGLPSVMPLVPSQLIIFLVGEVSYGLGLTVVREVQAWTGASPLPGMPFYVRGIIHLRGALIPIIDLRARLNQGLTDVGDEHVLIIIAINNTRFAILVDGISEIITMNTDDIKPVPFGLVEGVDDFLAGLVETGDNMCVILNAKRVVGIQ